jgi:hypothetical protein
LCGSVEKRVCVIFELYLITMCDGCCHTVTNNLTRLQRGVVMKKPSVAKTRGGGGRCG